MTQRLDIPKFNMVHSWARFVRTGDRSHMYHFRDMLGLQYINEQTGNDMGDQELFASLVGSLNKTVTLNDLRAAIAAAAREIFIPSVTYTLQNARFDNSRPIIAVLGAFHRAATFPDGSGAVNKLFGDWRLFCFSKDFDSYYQMGHLVNYTRFMRNALFRGITKEYKSTTGSMVQATKAVIAELKPEFHDEYASTIKIISSSGNDSPWSF